MEWIEEKNLIKTYCKICHKEGFLLAEIKSVGNNILIDFILQHEDGTTHSIGRKILRSIAKVEYVEMEGELDERNVGETFSDS